jgi:hypothetical protein
MHSSAVGTMDRIVFLSFSSAVRFAPVKFARYSSMFFALGCMRNLCSALRTVDQTRRHRIPDARTEAPTSRGAWSGPGPDRAMRGVGVRDQARSSSDRAITSRDHDRSSRDRPLASHGHDRSSGDRPTTSHDHPRSSHDHPRSSHDHPRSSHDHPRSSHDLLLTSHNCARSCDDRSWALVDLHSIVGAQRLRWQDQPRSRDDRCRMRQLHPVSSDDLP